MKRRIVGLSLAVLAIAAIARAMVVVYQGPLVNESGLAYNNTYTLDTLSTHVDYVGAQAVYAKAAPSAVTFTDGQVSTMSLTVSGLTSLTTAYASDKITIASNSALSGAVLTINGTTLTEGVDWSKAAVSSNTALSLKGAIDRRFSSIIATSLASGASVIFTTSTAAGLFANAYTMSSSTQAALTVNSATFAGGQDNATIAINGTPLIRGRDWYVMATASMTAKSISDAINATTALSAIITSTWTAAGVVTATSTAQGTAVNYSLYSSTPTALTFVPASAMVGGSGNNVDTTTSKINKANTFTTGLAVLYTKTAGTNPGTLVVGTTYYAIPVDANNFKLASSTTNAVAGTNVAITTTSTGGGSFTLTPLAYAGTPSFKWQASNDGTNYSDLSVSSVTYTGASTTPSTTLWDFAAYDYRYLRVNVLAPTAGGFNLVVTLQGKNTSSK